MKDYRDMKPMKRAGHEFMADGGFTGSAGAQAVKPYMRKTPGKPAKPDFKRRAMLPGGLATGGRAPANATDVAIAGGVYAKGGRAKHDDVAADKALIRSELAKRGLKNGGLTAAANFARGKADAAKLDRAAQSQPKKFAKGGVYSKKPVLGSK